MFIVVKYDHITLHFSLVPCIFYVIIYMMNSTYSSGATCTLQPLQLCPDCITTHYPNYAVWIGGHYCLMRLFPLMTIDYMCNFTSSTIIKGLS